MRLLLVEDDAHLGKATAEGLRESYAVDWAHCLAEARKALKVNQYELVVLDIGLPDGSGLDLLSDLRKNKNYQAVILLTAFDALQHRVKGLNTGADDYLVKPFDLDELLARCAAIIRRCNGQSAPIIQYKNLTYETTSCSLKRDGEFIILTQREQTIFDYLIRNIGRPVSKNKIMQGIYDWNHSDIESNTIEVHIASLRKKLGNDLIRTIRNVGYLIPK